MKRSSIKAFIISCMLWAMPGLAAGGILAAYASAVEYQSTAALIGSVLEGESLPYALKNRLRTTKPDQNSIQYLNKYGYHKLGNWGTYLPGMLITCLILFELAGTVIFLIKQRKENIQIERINELALYLRSAKTGEASALTRREDSFSHLEDEIYKTVVMLAGTKEEALKDHEVLAARIADIAHQLKTPLTSMSLMTELLEPYHQAEEKEYLERLKHQVERLKKLVEGLLTLAKLDSHTLEFQPERLDAEQLIDEAVEPLSEMIKQKSIQLHITKEEGNDQGIWLHADLHWTAEALINVIKNCVEHTPETGDIYITYGQNPLYTEFAIKDSGNGISKKALPHLFERFYRGENAAKDSAGIGLALAKSILEKQNGQLQAENTIDGHGCFRIRFYTD